MLELHVLTVQVARILGLWLSTDHELNAVPKTSTVCKVRRCYCNLYVLGGPTTNLSIPVLTWVLISHKQVDGMWDEGSGMTLSSVSSA